MMEPVQRATARGRILQSAVIVFATLGFLCGPTAGEEIRWRSGPAQMPRLNPPQSLAVVADLLDQADSCHVVVQFDQPISSADRRRFQRTGLGLLRYVGSHAYFAVLSKSDFDTRSLGALPQMTAVRGIERAWKLHPRVLAGDVPSWAAVGEDGRGNTRVAVYVLFHSDVQMSLRGRAAVGRHEGVIRDAIASLNGLVVELPRSQINALADEDIVQWIEWPLPPLSDVNDSARALTQADTVQAPPYDLDGSGVDVLVYDGGTARASHVDFTGRLSVLDDAPTTSHATHVAGTIGGAGVADSTYTGMAPAVTLLSYGLQHDGTGIFLYTNPGDIESDYDEAINVYGADLSNNSIGTNTETNGFDCSIQGDYGVTAALLDGIVQGSLGAPFRIIWAGGNERQGDRCDVEGYGDYYSVAPPAGAKNPIAVGALNSNDDSMTTFSSWGPLDDGRLKPDVSAPGCQSNDDNGVTSCGSNSDTAYTTKCGTSMASPTVAGLTALLLEDFRNEYPASPDPLNSTVKALLAHNAEDILNVGPDYQSGYGSVRIQQTIDFLRSGRFLEDEVDQGGTQFHFALVDGGDSELRITLAWDDAPGTPNVALALVNDLDLQVFSPSGVRYYPWTLDPTNPSAPAIQTQADHINNLEQVLVESPAAGVWQIEVYGFDVPAGPQPFSLCVSAAPAECSSRGIIALDTSLYTCESTAEIQVIDCDLNTDSEAVETTTAVVASDSEPLGETVLLTETGDDTADFRGSITLSSTNSASILQVADSDTITATYLDADDGLGGTDVPVATTAAADCAGPAVSGVTTTTISSENATVTFQTDERAGATVRYGTSCSSLTDSVDESSSAIFHEVLLDTLDDGTTYYFAIDAVDELGNEATDDNEGLCYSFDTLYAAYAFPFDSDPGWTTEGQWEFGQPLGGGGEYGNPDPTSGYTGTNVYGYNLSGDYDDNIPEYHLTTGPIDCSVLNDVQVTFRRWLGVEHSDYDHAYFRISNDGSNWTPVWENDTGISETEWTFQQYDVSAMADAQATVYLRWTMGSTDIFWRYCGWNIDDVKIIASNLPGPTCDDGLQNQGEQHIDCGGPCPPCECVVDEDCNDGEFCTGVESCDAYGQCSSGDDPCPGQLCNEVLDACVECLTNEDCDDFLFCNGAETCVDGTCYAGSAIDCADATTCTIDSCNEETDSCDHMPDDSACDNGLYCDGVEICDILLGCQAGSTVDCADGVSCTVDSCNEDTDSCDHVPNDAACENGLWCDGMEVCDILLGCIDGTPPCPPEQYCREADDLCVECLVAEHCDDGDPCSGTEICEADGTCAHVLSADCNDNDIEDECDLSSGTSLDCNENAIPDECDIASGESFDTNSNGVPDECDAVPPLVAPYPYDVRTNRYISFAPNTTERVAFQLSLAGSTYFPGCSGVLGWIGAPSLLDISRVQAAPFFSDDWPTVVHAGDCEIAPVATYEIRTTLDGVTFSDPLVLSTIARPEAGWWCDCVGSYVGVEWTAPNGVVNFNDIHASVVFFLSQANKPPLTRVDVHDEVPTANISFADIQLTVLAFQGAEYPYSDPCDCP